MTPNAARTRRVSSDGPEPNWVPSFIRGFEGEEPVGDAVWLRRAGILDAAAVICKNDLRSILRSSSLSNLPPHPTRDGWY
ncbi:hypothetical protein SBA2_110009 [Acidobacteriia bacterium SbA2]|nr:hypothetical protein SBA2_110009 [Acidobacteriia bacterium SbA2]